MPINSTSILVMWKQPDPPNGILRFYRVTYTLEPLGNMPTTVNTRDNSTSLVIEGLEPFTRYFVFVLGVTVSEGTPSEVVMVQTNESGRYSVLSNIIMYVYVCTPMLIGKHSINLLMVYYCITITDGFISCAMYLTHAQ